MTSPEAAPASTTSKPERKRPARDRSLALSVWYRFVQQLSIMAFSLFGGVRATGREHMPEEGGVLLVSNHVSFFDVFLLGLLLPRPLNYVARSTLFMPGLAQLMRSVGGFPIQREGMGTQGVKETLRRLRNGGIVTLFPEGTRSRDGHLGALKPGIATLVSRAKVPVVPAGIAGAFEAWPRSSLFPRPHAVHIHYGPAIQPSELLNLETEAVVALVHDRMAEALATAREHLSLQDPTAPESRQDGPAGPTS
jgi:1-acyl-sn-glycerol-3-phosphate acyltransferase